MALNHIFKCKLKNMCQQGQFEPDTLDQTLLLVEGLPCFEKEVFENIKRIFSKIFKI